MIFRSRGSDISSPARSVISSKVADRYYPDYVGFARWFYRRRQFPLYQIIWPNTDGLYPWDTNAPDCFKQWQPILGESRKGR